MKFIGLILAAVVVEGIVSYIKMIYEDGKFEWKIILAMALGILVAFAYQVDIFDIFELKSTIPYVGMVLTGILISRGSNYIRIRICG